MDKQLLSTIVTAIGLGVAAQVFADRLKLPAILPLLVFGMAAGPEMAGVISPNSLGEGLEVVIHLGVAIILFEGGLSLDLRRLYRVGGAVRNLLTIGVFVSGLGAAILSAGFIGMHPARAILFGAITTVTGPTVIAPLLRHLSAPREVKTVLHSEGLIVDPIGAVLAYMVLQWMELADYSLREMTGEVMKIFATGGILGFSAGKLMNYLLRSRQLNKDLTNIVVLGILLFCYLLSEHESRHSGILAAIVMGFTLSGSQLPDIEALKYFKGQISTLIISFLFILLAGQLDLASIWGLGWRGLLVTAGLVLLIRPLSVLLCVRSPEFRPADRFLLMMTAPRGIIAAAMASLAASQLREIGLPGGNMVEGLVYLTILVTCIWSTIMACILPRLLGYTRDPARKCLVLVGANALTEELALHLRLPGGGSTVVIDSSSKRLERFQTLDVLTICGDARDTATYEQAGIERDAMLIAATTNDALNLLVAELVRRNLGVEHPAVILQRPPEEFGRRSRAWADLLSGRALELERWIRLLEAKQASLLLLPQVAGGIASKIRELEHELSEEFTILAAWENDRPSFQFDREALEGYGALTVLAAKGTRLDELRALLAAEEGSPPAPGTTIQCPPQANSPTLG